MPLTAKQIEGLTVTTQDSSNLVLKVSPSGGKSWVLRYQFAGKRHNLGLGAWPLVSATAARQKAMEYRRMLAQGQDPGEAHRARKRPTGPTTLREVTEATIDALRPSWRPGAGSEKTWRQSLELHVLKALGHRPCSSITRADVIDTLRPAWADSHVTATRVLKRLERILDTAVGLGLMDVNPAAPGPIKSVLGARTRVIEHHPAPTVDELALAYKRLGEGTPGWAELAVQWALLSWTRSTEAAQARWEEIDEAAGTWTIPGGNRGRMKAGRPQRVHLTAEHRRILELCAKWGGKTGLLFADHKPKGPAKSTTLRALRRANGAAVWDLHGCRTTANTWALERGYPERACDLQLSHKLPDRVLQAYSRAEYWDIRVGILDEWASVLAG